MDTRWLAAFRCGHLGNMAAHGLRNLNGDTASYFAFAQIPGRLTSRHARLLELLVPHMHVTLARVLAHAKAAQPRINGVISMGSDSIDSGLS